MKGLTLADARCPCHVFLEKGIYYQIGDGAYLGDHTKLFVSSDWYLDRGIDSYRWGGVSGYNKLGVGGVSTFSIGDDGSSFFIR